MSQSKKSVDHFKSRELKKKEKKKERIERVTTKNLETDRKKMLSRLRLKTWMNSVPSPPHPSPKENKNKGNHSKNKKNKLDEKGVIINKFEPTHIKIRRKNK